MSACCVSIETQHPLVKRVNLFAEAVALLAALSLTCFCLVTCFPSAPPASVSGEWTKSVTDEGQEYYWNTVTGETSWELPPALAGTPLDEFALTRLANAVAARVSHGSHAHDAAI